MGGVLPADIDLAFVLTGLRKVIAGLHAYPRVCRAAECFGEANSHFRAYAGLFVHDPCEGLPGNAEDLSAFRNGQAQRLEAGALYDASGVGGGFIGMGVFSLQGLVVVDQFNIASIRSFKAEDNSSVGLHRHGPVAFQVALEWMRSITGQVQVLRVGGIIKYGQYFLNGIDKIRAYPAAVVALIQAFEAPVPECPRSPMKGATSRSTR